jgi:hypothetical protein
MAVRVVQAEAMVDIDRGDVEAHVGADRHTSRRERPEELAAGYLHDRPPCWAACCIRKVEQRDPDDDDPDHHQQREPPSSQPVAGALHAVERDLRTSLQADYHERCGEQQRQHREDDADRDLGITVVDAHVEQGAPSSANTCTPQFELTSTR